jgi:hypothetical protein
MQSSSLTVRVFAIALTCAVGPLTSAHAQLQIVLNPKPQYSGNSCRSYGLALAVGTLPSSPLPVSDARQLREAEKSFQAKLESLGNASSHETWRKAVDELSSGKLELVLEYPTSYEALYKRVRDLTKVHAADTLGSFLTIAVGATPVMTSVMSVGDNRYSTGHIVTVYGVSSQPVTPTPLVLLNPAVKVADKTKLACELDDVPNDAKWSASASLETKYELKKFGNGYLVMWVRKK